MTSPEALAEEQGGGLGGKTLWQKKKKKSCKRQSAFLGSRQKQMRNFREAAPNLSGFSFSCCN